MLPYPWTHVGTPCQPDAWTSAMRCTSASIPTTFHCSFNIPSGLHFGNQNKYPFTTKLGKTSNLNRDHSH